MMTVKVEKRKYVAVLECLQDENGRYYVRLKGATCKGKTRLTKNLARDISKIESWITKALNEV